MADSKSKVVLLRSAPPLGGAADIALARLKEVARDFLSKRLRTVFDTLDDAFFDLAEKAESSRQQTLYFDAMRAIRMERANIESHFFRQIDLRFLSMQPKASPSSVSKASHSKKLNDLELVGEDHLEEMIALDTMVSKSLESVFAPLDELTARLSRLFSRQLAPHVNPYGPESLCDIFGEGSRNLSIDIRSRLVLYKLFERKVIAELGSFYQKINKVLDEQGVLPVSPGKKTVKPAVKSKPNKPQTSQVNRDALTASSSAVGSVNGKEIPPKGRKGRLVKRIARLSNYVSIDCSEPSSEYVDASVNSLIDELLEIKKGANDFTCKEDGEVCLTALIEQQLRCRSDSSSARLHHEDRQIIQLIDDTLNCFDQNSGIPSDVYRLIQQLKLPILKVALRDAAFFDKPRHPARRLLNELAQISMRFEEGIAEQKDPLFGQIQRLASQLLIGETVELADLTSLYADFLSGVEKYERRIRVLERRVLEESAAKERINEAHTQVVEFLANLVEGIEVPLALLELAEQAWSRVLFLDCLRGGDDAGVWQEDVEVFQRLVKLINKGLMFSDAYQEVIVTIKARLDHVAFDSPQAEALLSRLDYSESGSGAKEKVVLVEAFYPVLPGKKIERDDDVQDSRLLAEVDALQRGGWFDLGGSNVRKRCKLAGVLAPHSNYIFVDRLGNKEVVLSRAAVAQKIRNKELRHIDNQKLFDRSLDHVIEQLKNSPNRVADKL